MQMCMNVVGTFLITKFNELSLTNLQDWGNAWEPEKKSDCKQVKSMTQFLLPRWDIPKRNVNIEKPNFRFSIFNNLIINSQINYLT